MTVFWLPAVLSVPFLLRLSYIDLRSHRLPNVQVVALTVVVTCGMSAAAVFGNHWTHWSQAWAIAACTFMVYLALHVLSRGQLGMGDVKFAFPVGLIIGWFNPDMRLYAIWWTFALAGIVALFGNLKARLSKERHLDKRNMALGPFMSSVCVIVASLPIWH